MNLWTGTLSLSTKNKNAQKRSLKKVDISPDMLIRMDNTLSKGIREEVDNEFYKMKQDFKNLRKKFRSREKK